MFLASYLWLKSQAYNMVRSLSQETVDEVAKFNRQAQLFVESLLMHYLDPNVPEVNW